MVADTSEIKPIIRSILLALGRRASENEFWSEYKNVEGESFSGVLKSFKMTFYEFMKTMPDVGEVFTSNGEVFVERVSTKESCHMDNLTIKGNNKQRNRFRPNSGSYRQRNIHQLKSYSFKPAKKQFSRVALSRKVQLSSTNTSRDKPNLVLKANAPGPRSVRPRGRPLPLSNEQKRKIVCKSEQKSQKQPKKPIQKQPLPPLPHQLTKKIVYKAVTESKKQPHEPLKMHLQPLPDDLTKQIIELSLNFVNDGETKEDSSANDHCKTVSSSIQPMISSIKRCLKPAEQKGSVKDILTISVSSDSDTPKSTVLKAISKSSRARANIETEAESNIAQISASNVYNMKPTPSKRRSSFFKRKISLEIMSSHHEDKLQNYLTVPTKIRHPSEQELDFPTLFEVKIIEVLSPWNFMFQFHQKQLDRMMDQMNRHYKALKDPEKFMIHEVIIGMTVAAKYKEKCYRVEILSVFEEHILAVFVDNGDVKSIKKSCLFYLEKSFQAPFRNTCRGTLFGVKPNDEHRLRNSLATQHFIHKTKRMKMLATLKGCRNEVYSLALIDSNSLDVGRSMISRGFLKPA